MESAPGLEEVYDSATLRAIDGDQAAVVAVERASRIRGTAAGAAMMTSLVTGVRDSLDLEPDVAYEEIDPGFVGDPDRAVTLYFVPGDPHASKAILRRWLL